MITRSLVGAAWAGLLALDFTGFGPLMVSQPVVAGPLFGWLMGNITAGLIVGGIIQLLWMDVSPIGVGIPYDAMAATILATFWCAINPHCSLSQIMLALFIAVPLGFLFRGMDQFARRLNVRLVHRIDRVSDARLPTALGAGIVAGLVWSWLRYAVSYFVVMFLGERLWSWMAYSPRLTFLDQGMTMAAILLPVAGMGVTLELFLSEEPEGRWAAFKALRLNKRRDDK